MRVLVVHNRYRLHGGEERAGELLEPYREERVLELIRDRVLPALELR